MVDPYCRFYILTSETGFAWIMWSDVGSPLRTGGKMRLDVGLMWGCWESSLVHTVHALCLCTANVKYPGRYWEIRYEWHDWKCSVFIEFVFWIYSVVYFEAAHWGGDVQMVCIILKVAFANVRRYWRNLIKREYRAISLVAKNNESCLLTVSTRPKKNTWVSFIFFS